MKQEVAAEKVTVQNHMEMNSEADTGDQNIAKRYPGEPGIPPSQHQTLLRLLSAWEVSN